MSSSIEQRGIEILKAGVLPPDEKNILIFKNIVRDYALVTCFAFACGIAAAFPLAALSQGTSIEQSNRSPLVYKDGVSQISPAAQPYPSHSH